MSAELRVHVFETTVHIHWNPQYRHQATARNADKRSRFYPGVELTDMRKTVITRLEYDPNHRTTVYGGIGYSDASRNQNFPPR